MFNRYNFKSESGITLVELLVVIALISFLAGGIIMIFNPKAQIGKANDAKRKADLVQLQRALETYYQDYGRYPDNAGDYTIDDSGSMPWGGSWPSYMSKLPEDPSSPTRTYVYYSPNGGSCSNNQCYYLYASLERASDPQACNGGAVCTSVGANGLGANVCVGICNYGVTSTNVTP